MKTNVSFIKTILIFMPIIIAINFFLIFNENIKSLTNQQNIIAEKNREALLLNKRIKNLEYGLNYSNEELTYRGSSRYYYQMFYGIWQKTDNIYVEPHPMREIYYETEEEINEAKKKASEIFNYDLIYLRNDSVAFKNDKEQIILEPIYISYIFPYRSDFEPSYCWAPMLTLDDLGLNKNKYITYTSLCYNAKTDEERDILRTHKFGYSYDKFYIKDMDTIIFSNDFFYIEYKRSSAENIQNFDSDYYPI